MTTPNLDAMSVEELLEYRRSLPESVEYDLLASYSLRRVKEIKARLKGEIAHAQELAARNQNTYNRLPAYQRW